MACQKSVCLLVLVAIAAGLAGCGAAPATSTVLPAREASVTAAPPRTALPTAVATTAATEPPTEPPAALPTAPATAAPTQAPTQVPSPAPTLRPSATTPAGPQIGFFTITPTTTQNVGDVLDMSWEASGDRAEICPVSGPGPVENRCRAVELSGSTQFVTDEAAMSYTGFMLRVWQGTSWKLAVEDVRLQCKNLRPWFFGGQGEPAPPVSCPEAAADISSAAGEMFEHGFMVWVEDADDFYVFYEGQDSAGFQTFDWILEPQASLKPGASPDNRTGETPPPGLYEPVGGFGMIWRGEVEGVRPDVRDWLGWATGPEFAYETAYQCKTSTYPGMWDCFLRGPQGQILELRPDSTAQVRFLWEEW